MKTPASVSLALLGTLLVAGCAHSTSRSSAAQLEVVSIRHSYNNAHVLVSEGRALLIDTGTQEDAEKLDESLRSEGIDPEQIVAIVLTHGHVDHAGGAKWFQDRYDTPILVGSGDASLLASGHNDTLCPTDRQGEKRLADFQAAEFDPYEADLLISEPTDLMQQFDFPARVVPVAGHTEGSLVVLAGSYAFVGDLFRGDIFSSKAERHFYMCDLEDNQRDIEALLANEARTSETFFVGHFGPLTRDAVTQRFLEP